MEDELRLAGYLIAVFVRTADEDVAGTEYLVNPYALAGARPLMQLSLDGNVRDDFLVLVIVLIEFLLLVQDFSEFIELVAAGFLCIWGYYGYEPVNFVYHVFKP